MTSSFRDASTRMVRQLSRMASYTETHSGDHLKMSYRKTTSKTEIVVLNCPFTVKSGKVVANTVTDPSAQLYKSYEL